MEKAWESLRVHESFRPYESDTRARFWTLWLVPRRRSLVVCGARGVVGLMQAICVLPPNHQAPRFLFSRHLTDEVQRRFMERGSWTLVINNNNNILFITLFNYLQYYIKKYRIRKQGYWQPEITIRLKMPTLTLVWPRHCIEYHKIHVLSFRVC